MRFWQTSAGACGRRRAGAAALTNFATALTAALATAAEPAAAHATAVSTTDTAVDVSRMRMHQQPTPLTAAVRGAGFASSAADSPPPVAAAVFWPVATALASGAALCTGGTTVRQRLLAVSILPRNDDPDEAHGRRHLRRWRPRRAVLLLRLGERL